MIGFTNEHRQRFRVRLEEGEVRTDPYLIPASSATPTFTAMGFWA
jgi:hypothetical protein